MPRWSRQQGTGSPCDTDSGAKEGQGGREAQALAEEISAACDPAPVADTALPQQPRSWRRARPAVATAASAVRGPLYYLDAGRSIEVSVDIHGASLPEVGLLGLAADFRDQLRSIWLRLQGRPLLEVATTVGRTVAWVADRWERKPKPPTSSVKQLPPFIVDYELRMLRSGIEPFKPAELHRGFLSDPTGGYGNLYEECVSCFPWEQAVVRKRNQSTGEVTKTDVESNRQDCTFPNLRTGVQYIDEALERARRQLAIEDPGAYLTCNWYPDGRGHIAPHRHDFWSAILCVGAPRLFLLEEQPILLEHGDLLVFGTQKHSVPRMPQVDAGRVSVCIFWYPERSTPTDSLLLSASAADVATATMKGGMADLVLEALAKAGLSGEIVGGCGTHRDRQDDDSDPELMEALERSLLES